MNKNEFLNQLRKKLDVLSQDEIDELIAEYSEHIDNKILEGKTEEQAVSDFGDVGELSRNILQAYKLNENFTSKPKFNSFLHLGEESGRKLLSSFEQFYAKISISEVFKFLILVILSFGLVAILKFPFMLFKSISLWFMEIIFGYTFVDYIDGIWGFIVTAAYYLSSILLIISVVRFGQHRYMHMTLKNQNPNSKTIVNEDEKVSTPINEDIEYEEEIQPLISEEPISTNPKETKNGFSNFIHQIVNLFYLCILWSLRLLILAVLFPMTIAIIFGLFIWGMLVFLTFAKVPIIGLTFTTGMGLIFAACCIVVVFAFTFNIKLKSWRYSRILTVLAVTLILGGFGTIWSVNELSQFEWVSSDVKEYKEYEYQLSEFDKIQMNNIYRTQIEIDNSLDEKIIISLSPDLDNEDNAIELAGQTVVISMNSYTDVEELNEIRVKIVEQFNALKEGKLIFQSNDNSNQVIIRVSEKNFELIQNRIIYN